MPRLPWTTISTIEAETECVLVTTQATLRDRRDRPRFVASAQTLWTDLQAADGLIGYELHASMLGRVDPLPSASAPASVRPARTATRSSTTVGLR
jgi:hypothetical protein